MKIIVNRCYGGAGLSPEGVKTAVLNGVPLKHWDSEKTTTITAVRNSVVTDLGDGFFQHGDGLFSSVIKDGQVYTNHLSSDVSLRTHPGLIKTIEELGELANARFAELSVTEIPDDVEVTIEEYDGYEHVAEVHRTW